MHQMCTWQMYCSIQCVLNHIGSTLHDTCIVCAHCTHMLYNLPFVVHTHLLQTCTHTTNVIHNWLCNMYANDPSAGSPTETLLRLLLPLSDKVHKALCNTSRRLHAIAIQMIHRITQSVGATGGVYKGQGRNQPKLMTSAY